LLILMIWLEGKTPTLQLAWGDVKLLPPDLLTIWWELYFEELRSKENGTCCNVVWLKLQAKRCTQSACGIPNQDETMKKGMYIKISNFPYPSFTKFHATWARAFWATLNFFIASTRGLYGWSKFKSKPRVASTTLSPCKIISFCCSYTSCTRDVDSELGERKWIVQGNERNVNRTKATYIYRTAEYDRDIQTQKQIC